MKELFTKMSGTVNVEDRLACLSHRAVAEYLVSDRASQPLAVSLAAARQTMADSVMTWLAPVVRDEQAADKGRLL